MGRSTKIKLALAIFGIFLYTGDTGSDLFVGKDLVDRCHFRYAASVFSFMTMPGFILGIINAGSLAFEDGFSLKGLLLFLFGAPVAGVIGGFLFIPFGLVWLIWSAIKIENDETGSKAKFVKMLEMMFESFPQWVINMFIMQGLGVYGILNIASTFISGFSVIYGLGEAQAITANNGDPNYPFKKVVLGMITVLLDAVLRGCFLAYAMTIIKSYIVLIPAIYLVIILIVVIVIRKRDGESHKTLLSFRAFLGACLSFVCSSIEDHGINITFRLKSKCIFAVIFIALSATLYATHSSTLFHNNIKISSNFNSSHCENICPPANQTKVELEQWNEMIDYCENIWMTISPETHVIIWTVLGVLFALSIIEGIMEQCFSWMPYRKLYEGTDIFS